MARPEIERPANGPEYDDLDALFEVDHGMDDIFDAVRREAGAEDDRIRAPKEITYRQKGKEDPNDVDEEIKIIKKRTPIAKLDEKRLLSDAGISKLQKMSKTKFKFRGKGHEFSDIARILRMYQLWLDDMYPRAKFIDGLTIIEKLGHSKRMQLQRKAWIEEGKPRPSGDDHDTVPDAYQSDTERGGGHGGEIVRAGTRSLRSSLEPGVNGSEANESIGKRDEQAGHTNRSLNDKEYAEPDEDELDALLAVEPNGSGNHITYQPTGLSGPTFDDDEEAMREMNGMDDLW